MKILLADDDRFIRSGFKKVLEAEGYEVMLANDGVEAVEKFVLEGADAVILDLMMPKKNGFVACEEIRQHNAKVPILFLTGNDTDANQLRGFGVGADDFIVKDAGKEIVLARLKRALERVIDSEAEAPIFKLLLGRTEVRLDLGLIRFANGKETRLTRTEVQILGALAERRGTMQTAADIIKRIRGEGCVCDESMIYVHLSHLRSKLGDEADRIVSVRGIGYCLSISSVNMK